MKRFRYLSALVVMVSVVLLLADCSPSLVKGTPKLPPGFLEAPVPEGDLSAYLYLAQESPMTIPLAKFGDPALAADNPSFPLGEEIPETVGINWLALVVGPDLDFFGGVIEFNRDILAEMAEDVMSGRSEVSVWRRGNLLGLVRGTECKQSHDTPAVSTASSTEDSATGTTEGCGWADAMDVALRSGTAAPFQDAYPDSWELLRLLPENPPMDPVAAGFIQVDGTLLDSLASKAGLGLSGLGQALGSINITDIAYAAYTNEPLNLPEEFGRDYLENSGVGAVFVAQSSYPGFLLGFFLNTFADSIGLETGTEVGGQDVLSREEGGMHLLVKPVGSTIFLVLASSSQDAELLMASVLGPQNE